jgi:GxxExxY protein
MSENEISYAVRGAIFTVYNRLGPGLLESAYEAALKHQLEKEGFEVRKQVPLPMVYDEVRLDVGYRVDLVVNQKVIIEVKSCDGLEDVHHKQVLTYLNLSGMKLGILVNFNTAKISESICRKILGTLTSLT